MSSLVGRKSICTYCSRSWQTVRLWIREEKFPAAFLNGVWESNTKLIDDWKEKKIVSIVKDEQ